MAAKYPLVDVAGISIEGPPAGGDWSGVALRVAVSGREGADSTAFQCVVEPGASVPWHVRARGEQIAIVLAGEAVLGIDGGTAAVRPGHCFRVPAGAAHRLVNASDTAPVVLAGFHPGVPDLEASGFRPRDGAAPGNGPLATGTLVHLDDVAPEQMDERAGWMISDFRLPFGRHNGSASTLFRARFFPGAVHKKHRHTACAEIYHVISGEGLAGAGEDRVRVRGGHFHFIPPGVEHWLHNLSEDDPIEVVGIYLGAGSVAETGYVYTGEVTSADLG